MDKDYVQRPPWIWRYNYTGRAHRDLIQMRVSLRLQNIRITTLSHLTHLCIQPNHRWPYNCQAVVSSASSARACDYGTILTGHQHILMVCSGNMESVRFVTRWVSEERWIATWSLSIAHTSVKYHIFSNVSNPKLCPESKWIVIQQVRIWRLNRHIWDMWCK